MTSPLQRLRAAQEGVTAVEFGIVAPVLVLLLLGGFDMAHTLYMRTVLQGIVQKTARDASLEDSAEADVQATLDAKVGAQVKALANNATVTTTRRFYRTFTAAAAARREDFTDNNNNGTCDPPRGSTPGEPYQDANNNGRWDADGGDAGQGGARDRTVYTVTVSYPRMFPMARMIGLSDTVTATARTVLANQPYTDQGSYAAPTARNCP